MKTWKVYTLRAVARPHPLHGQMARINIGSAHLDVATERIVIQLWALPIDGYLEMEDTADGTAAEP